MRMCVNVYTYPRKRNGPIMGSLIKEAWKRLVHLQTIHLNLPLTWKERDSMARGTLAPIWLLCSGFDLPQPAIKFQPEPSPLIQSYLCPHFAQTC